MPEMCFLPCLSEERGPETPGGLAIRASACVLLNAVDAEKVPGVFREEPGTPRCFLPDDPDGSGRRSARSRRPLAGGTLVHPDNETAVGDAEDVFLPACILKRTDPF